MYTNRYLPNPLQRADGSLVTRPEEWEEQRQYLKNLAQEHMYGQWPGKPEKVTGVIEHTELAEGESLLWENLLLTVNYQGSDFSLHVKLARPNDQRQHHTIIANSAITLDPNFQDTYSPLFVQRGYAVATLT